MRLRTLIAIALMVPLLGVSCSELLATNVKTAAGWAAREGGRLIQESGSGFVRNLSELEKRVIDEWLAANNLNEFGDKLGTFYAGGTPLFNEATGETIDRFKYLFEKFPGLKRVIETEIKKQAEEASQ